jgi:hypothetical protein
VPAVPQPVRAHPQALTDHTIETTLDEGVLLIQLNRPEVRKALDERTQACKGR